MNWLTRLLSTRSETANLDAALRDALELWQTLPPPDLGKVHFETRYVVVNTEATGLNLDTDHLLAVGAIAVEGGVISPREAYYAKLEPDPAAALTDLLVFCGSGPAVVFNAAFNRTMLERVLAAHLGIEPEWAWLDLHWLLPALYGEHADGRVRLEDWMRSFGIETFQRHHGLGDAWAIARLLLATQGRALANGLNTARSLVELERARRQMHP